MGSSTRSGPSGSGVGSVPGTCGDVTGAVSGHLVTVISTSGLKIVPTQAVYAGTKNAVRTFMEALRQENTDGSLRTTSISPGYVRTPFSGMAELGIDPDAVARTIEFSIDQPDDVEIGDLTIRPTRQG